MAIPIYFERLGVRKREPASRTSESESPFDIYPPDTGMLVQPGDRVSWNLHYYPIGQEVKGDVVEVGL